MAGANPPMIKVINANKSYGREEVLVDLNMTVPKGKIYSLIGPSGCGKTVLLTSILACRPLDSGVVKLGVTRKAEVGYMPQEVALFDDFKVGEVFCFFGRIFGMRFEEARKRYDTLAKLLDLASYDCQIGSLSGGEQRRVSLAVAMIHEPKLLILDEPTVGLDPLLSCKIWNYLIETTGTGVTAVITTHYVEEARKAHVVAMMRDGHLLIEDSPEAVMSNLNVDSLESAFLCLCQNQTTHPGRLIKDCDERKSEERIVVTFQNEPALNWNRFVAQLVKNYIWMKRNTTVISMLLLLPAIQSMLFCLTLGRNPSNLPVAVVPDELAFNGTTQPCDTTNVKYIHEDFNCTTSPPFSCQFLQHLRRSTNVVIYDRASARAAVEKNEAWAMLHMKKNFSTAITELVLGRPFGLDDDFVEWNIDQSTIDVYMDSSNYIINQVLRKQLVDSYNDFTRDLVKSCHLPDRQGSSPLQFMDPVFGTKSSLFGDSGLPGFTCSFTFLFAVQYTSGSLMTEKIVGVLDRSMISGLTFFEVVLAHLVTQLALVTLEKAIMLLVLYVIYDNHLVGSLSLVVSLLFAIEIVGITYGFLITEVFSTDRMVTYAAIGGTLSVFGVAGIVWPLEGAYPILRDTVWAFPISPAVDSYRGVVLKGFGLTHWHVLSGFLSCLVWTLLFGLATVFTLRVKQKGLL